MVVGRCYWWSILVVGGCYWWSILVVGGCYWWSILVVGGCYWWSIHREVKVCDAYKYPHRPKQNTELPTLNNPLFGEYCSMIIIYYYYNIGVCACLHFSECNHNFLFIETTIFRIPPLKILLLARAEINCS